MSVVGGTRGYREGMSLRLSQLLTTFGAATAVIAAAAAVALPAYSSGSGPATLLEVNGDRLLVLLAAFVAVALAPLLLGEAAGRRAALACGTALILGSFVTVVGVFFLPSGIALIAAGLATGGGSRTRAT
jgi:hypothetical protein